MLFHENEIIYVPDGYKLPQAIERTDILCIAAHQDDTEIMAYHAIEECYHNKDKHFTSVIVTDGAGSPRTGKYGAYTDDEMKNIRISEQNKAAEIGGYAAQLQLRYKSSAIKQNDKRVVCDIASIIKMCRPKIVYTHNLADKHETHVALALRVIQALHQIETEYLPEKLIGLEVWRGLDWLEDKNKVVYDASKNQDLARQLLEVFDSQIAGGKRYDEAALGRRKANATFFGDHRVDDSTSAIYGIDMTELMREGADAKNFIAAHIDDFKNSVADLIDKLSHSEEA